MTVMDSFKLNGKKCLVTGGAKGIGKKISEGLLEAGASTLIFCGRGRHGSLEDEESRLKTLFPEQDIRGIKCDISDEESINNMIEQICDISTLDVLVNNAGVTWAVPTLDQTLKSWNRTLDINLTGTFLLTKAIIKELMIYNKNGASILNISSMLAIKGVAELSQIGYSATKSALLGLTRQLAVEFAGNNIRVNAILPGFIEGDSMAEIFTKDGSPIRESLVEMVPLKRLVSQEDIQGIVTFLASDAASYITGQSIVLCGGASVKI
ncbi:MAG: SDR family NAD(P)-dependent oxidoreductase [Candidatus Hodarchaeales archaeon]|jgi:gluconate 5-dehydrogenase